MLLDSCPIQVCRPLIKTLVNLVTYITDPRISPQGHLHILFYFILFTYIDFWQISQLANPFCSRSLFILDLGISAHSFFLRINSSAEIFLGRLAHTACLISIGVQELRGSSLYFQLVSLGVAHGGLRGVLWITALLKKLRFRFWRIAALHLHHKCTESWWHPFLPPSVQMFPVQ